MALAPFFVGLLTLALIYGLLALALNVQFGYTGLLNFGHVAFFAAGAFASAIATLPPRGSEAYLESGGSYEIGLGLPVPVGFLLGGLAAGLLALLVGATSIRLSSHYLAIATFAMAEIFRSFLNNEGWLTRGQFGIPNVPQPGRGTVLSVTDYPVAYLLVTAVVVALLLALTIRLTESPYGRALRAVRDDETAARMLGKYSVPLKLSAFVAGGILAGFAGSIWTHWLGVVHVGQFVPIITFQVWLAVLLGGAGNHWGVLLGALVLTLIREGTRFIGEIPGLDTLTARNPSFIPSLRYVLIGFLLIFTVRFFPQGLIPERIRKAPAWTSARPNSGAASAQAATGNAEGPPQAASETDSEERDG